MNARKSSGWSDILKMSHLDNREYQLHEKYPLVEFETILTKGAELMGMSLAEVKEKFGEDLVPALLGMYGKFVDPKWKTFDLLLYTEMIMHKAVRKEENKADPPVLNVSRVHDKLLIIDYYSKRKMANLAVGIIKGIAKQYNESDRVKVIPVTEPDEERVQIRIEFL